ncbi:MAG: transglycosylase SLT domain-containing protein [Rhodanobacteraceae bacterium]|nr:transglycosylase SLT domain-containing protein [Rhodanobacteraceae bacterium]
MAGLRAGWTARSLAVRHHGQGVRRQGSCRVARRCCRIAAVHAGHGARLRLARNSGFDDRFDPALITRANADYLNDRFRELNNDLELALGAYNGGEGRMRRLSGNGSRGFWEAPVYNALPPETRDYVPMVLAAAWLFLHPEDYGLEFAKFDARPGQIVLERAMSINELSVCMGQFGNPRGWFRTLRNLNPRYEADARIDARTTPDVPEAAAKAYAARCRSGLLAQTAAG